MPTVKFKSIHTRWVKSRKRRMISDAGERLWVALLCESDSYGDIEAYSDDLLHELFRGVVGWTEAKVNKHIQELAECDLLIVWEDEYGKPWAHIVGHDEYQSGYLLRKRTGTRPSGGPNPVKHIGYSDESRPGDAIGRLGIGIEKGIGIGIEKGTGTGTTPTGEVAHEKQIVEIFEHWKQVFNKSATTVMDTARKRRINWVLKTYGIDVAKQCIDGYALDDWAGRKKNHDIILLFEDAAHVEAGLSFKSGQSEKPLTGEALYDAMGIR